MLPQKKFNITYRTGEDDLLNEFYIPALSSSTHYFRAVGYFSSSALKLASTGIYRLIKNNGNMRLVCGAISDPMDQAEIEKGYRERIEKNLSKEMDNIISLHSQEPDLLNLAWLVANNRLDIAIAWKEGPGIYHEKIGVFEDSEGNVVAFTGSSNETRGGLIDNWESIDVYCSWQENERANQKRSYFEKLWNQEIPGLNVVPFPDAPLEKLKSIAPPLPVPDQENALVNTFRPWKHQTNAIQTCIDGNGVALFEMATGTGKTRTALATSGKFDKWRFLIIIVPGNTLVAQWENEIRQFYPAISVLKCDSTNRGWKESLFFETESHSKEKLIIVTTYDTASNPAFLSGFQKFAPWEYALIFDEAHKLGALTRRSIMGNKPEFRIGLTATPTRLGDEEGTQEILNYFNNNIFRFGIEEAIPEYLCPYILKANITELDQNEWFEYLDLTRQISKAFARQNTKTDDENSVKITVDSLLRRRARIIKKNTAKLPALLPILKEEERLGGRVLIYCEDMVQLNSFLVQAKNKGISQISKFTGDESPAIREKILAQFSVGGIKKLFAIRCLDEGVDIPCCDAAILVASSTSTREYIQRRGRVLRKGRNKETARIYDFLTIPAEAEIDDENREIAKQLINNQLSRIEYLSTMATNSVSALSWIYDYLKKHEYFE